MVTIENRKAESGQGSLEYILLLVITVGLILVFAQPQAKRFGQFANVIFGDYLACLLDRAVLPGDQGCAEIFTSANASFSKNATGFQANNGTNQSGNQASNKSSGLQNEMASSRSGGNRTSRSRNNGGVVNSGLPTGADHVSAEEVESGAGPAAPPPSRFVRVSKSGKAVAPPAEKTPVKGYSELAAKEKERLDSKKKVSVVGAADFDDSGRPRKSKVPDPKRKVAQDEGSDGTGFGDFARYLIIIAIILALLVFLGSQANQISKSMEK